MQDYQTIRTDFVTGIKGGHVTAFVNFMEFINGANDDRSAAIARECFEMALQEEDFRKQQAKDIYLIALETFLKFKNKEYLTILHTYNHVSGISPAALDDEVRAMGGETALSLWHDAEAKAPAVKLGMDFMKAVGKGDAARIAAFFDKTVTEPALSEDAVQLPLKEAFRLAMASAVQKQHEAVIKTLLPYAEQTGTGLMEMKKYALHAGGIEGLKLFDRISGTAPKM